MWVEISLEHKTDSEDVTSGIEHCCEHHECVSLSSNCHWITAVAFTHMSSRLAAGCSYPHPLPSSADTWREFERCVCECEYPRVRTLYTPVPRLCSCSHLTVCWTAEEKWITLSDALKISSIKLKPCWLTATPAQRTRPLLWIALFSSYFTFTGGRCELAQFACHFEACWQCDLKTNRQNNWIRMQLEC